MSGLRDLVLSARRTIPARLLDVRFSRSGGPGGQNVNKVETKVDLRLDLDRAAEVLTDAMLARIESRLQNRIDKERSLRVVCDEYRDQSRNIDAACARMEALIKGALAVQKTRRPTKPSRRAKARRVDDKKKVGEKKKQRQRQDWS